MEQKTKSGLFTNYPMNPKIYDELFDNTCTPRPHFEEVLKYFGNLRPDDFKKLHDLTRKNFYDQGITFAVYSDQLKGVERIFPFDLLPRIIEKSEWDEVEKGLIQRNKAINLFLQDIYNKKEILKDGIVPAELIFSSKYYCREMMNFVPPGGIYTHITGSDLIRHNDGKYYVLEDNLRCPSGVSYVLANREAMKKAFYHLFHANIVHPVVDYPQQLLNMLQSFDMNNGYENPSCVILTPGVYNSAYYEHSFLAQSMGIPLVEGRDLFIENNYVYMKTIYGPTKVDVIYRRIDDEFLDPLVFREDSLIGVPGLMGAYREGNVNIVNAPGTGCVDDKAVYRFIPDIIRYYLDEEPILNNVHTYRCELDDDYQYVMDHFEELVHKPVDESGGYGVFVAFKHTKEEQEAYKKQIMSNRRKYIAQPVMSLSTAGTFIEDKNRFEPRHIDLRSFCLMGRNENFVLKGGLTRVALTEGSLIVNSSQGGGSKDTWVIN